MRLVFFRGFPGLPGRVPDRLLRHFRVRPPPGVLPGQPAPDGALQGRREELLRERVTGLTLAFGLLTPLWIGVDAWVLPRDLWQDLALLRLLASLAFLALFARLAWGPGNGAGDAAGGARRWMRLLFAIPALFHLASQHLLGSLEPAGLQVSLVQAYTFLPFVMMAGLALFPLAPGEAAELVLLVLLVQVLTLLGGGGGEALHPGLGALWLLALIGAVSATAGICQLRLMEALTRQLFHDPLTGCLSRRSLEEMLEHHFALACRTQASLSVAFLDLDHFKAINDRFGHDAGDRVLVQAAAWLRTHLRRSALVGRWGGEEFLLIFPGADRREAFQALSRIRGEGLGLRPDGVPLTASIGLAERRLDRARDWQALVDLADSRMYIAKQGGRNRLVVA